MRQRARAPYSTRGLLASACAALCLLALPAHAATFVESTTGVAVTVVSDGTYTIQFSAPAWTFSGSVNGGAMKIHTTSGHDAAGAFQEIGFDERAKPGRHFS